ncbi:hypothetical protein KI387_026357, partial [Taxus chinensis]
QNQNRNRLTATPKRLEIENAPRNNLEMNEEDHVDVENELLDEEYFVDPIGDSNIDYLDYESDEGYYESFEYSDGHTFM